MINQYVNDSMVFRFPLFYNQRLPDHKSGMITVQETPKHQFNDAFAPNILGLSQPEPFLPIQFRLYNEKLMKSRIYKNNMVPVIGLEPTTPSLRMRCSTN